jgi:hypothetical protein
MRYATPAVVVLGDAAELIKGTAQKLGALDCEFGRHEIFPAEETED